jgi:hypothetical protein
VSERSRRMDIHIVDTLVKFKSTNFFLGGVCFSLKCVYLQQNKKRREPRIKNVTLKLL